VAFNDVDLCLKIGRAGYRIVWTPGAVAEHRESLSRGDDMRPDQQSRFFAENETMLRRWQDVLPTDKFYHRAFSRSSGLFTDLDVPCVMDVDAGKPEMSEPLPQRRKVEMPTARPLPAGGAPAKASRERRSGRSRVAFDIQAEQK
jgi:hypothetical protein